MNPVAEEGTDEEWERHAQAGSADDEEEAIYVAEGHSG